MNETVFEYCEKFIKAEKSPRFAILIKGEWGVGKTFFIKKMIQTLRLDSKDYVYLSLYGLKSIEDINMKLFEAMHPFLSSPQMKLMGSVVKSALKLGADFEFELPIAKKKVKAKAETGTISLEKLGEIQAKRNLIIVDDIERLGDNLSIQDVFGFFQDLIVESDSKVIFVGNETKIVEKKEEQLYAVIKEKTIGQEFLICPDIQEAIDTFAEELSFHRNIKETIKTCAVKVVENLKCQNLRCIRSALWNLNEHSQFILNDLYQDDREKFISTFLLLFIQKSLNKIEKADVPRALRIYEKYQIGYDCYKGQENNDYIDFLILNIPVLDLWSQIIFDGLTSKYVLFAAYQKECKDRKTKDPLLLFKVINSWRDYDDALFKKEVDKLVKEVDDGKYLHPGHLLHYANIMLLFSLWGIRSESARFIETQIKNVYVKYRVYPVSDFDGIKISFAGLSYSTNFQPFEKIKDIVEKLNYNELTKDLSKQVASDVNSLSDANIDDFCENLLMCNGNNKYRKFPFFKFIDMASFCSNFEKLTTKSRNQLICVLKERYGMEYQTLSSIEYKDDIAVLKNFRKQYAIGKSITLNSPRNMFAKIELKDIDAIIKYIENSIKIQTTQNGIKIPISSRKKKAVKANVGTTKGAKKQKNK